MRCIGTMPETVIVPISNQSNTAGKKISFKAITKKSVWYPMHKQTNNLMIDLKACFSEY